jgi:uncharacterized protein Usg
VTAVLRRTEPRDNEQRADITRTYDGASRGVDSMADRAFIQQLQGFSLTTAEILYRLPDHPSLLQSYIWQDYDLSPRFPKLQEFLDFWSKNLEGRLFKVRVAHKSLIGASELALVTSEFKLN